MTLKDLVMQAVSFDCRKHGLANNCEQWAEDEINDMTNYELLQEISDALESAGVLK